MSVDSQPSIEQRGPALPASGQAIPFVQALAQSRQAVSALAAAAQVVPARYNLGLRYRLQSLAHHLEQVAEFVEATARKLEGQA